MIEVGAAAGVEEGAGIEDGEVVAAGVEGEGEEEVVAVEEEVILEQICASPNGI